MEPRPLAILAALREELADIERQLTDRREVRSPARNCITGRLQGWPVVIARTGVGGPSARAAAEFVFRELAPSATLALGFAGGLRDDLRPGDLVLATEIFEPPPPDGDGPRRWEGDPSLIESIRKIGDCHVANRSGAPGNARPLRRVEGRMVTVRRAIQTGLEKRAFGERHRAIAVDMESSGIAQAAKAFDAKVVYLRTVIDEASFDLPLDFTRVLTPDGRLKPFGALGAILRRPQALKALGELRRRAILGAENLAACVVSLISILESQSPSPSR